MESHPPWPPRASVRRPISHHGLGYVAERTPKETSRLFIREGGLGHISSQEHTAAHQEGTEEDERDEVHVGQVGATALALALP